MNKHSFIFKQHYSYDTPIYKKYLLIFNTLDNIIKQVDFQHYFFVGRRPYSRTAFLKALIIKHLEGFKYTSDLIYFLKNHINIAILCGFIHNIPDDSTFYRAISAFNHHKLDSLFKKISQFIIQFNIASTDILSIDSKPIKAYSKFNNPKFNSKHKFDKNAKLCQKSNRNSEATLGHYSKTNDNKHEFFWGFRLHCITTKEDIPIAAYLLPNNIPDSDAAEDLIQQLNQYHFYKSPSVLLGDAAYDNNKFYNAVVKYLNAIPLTAINKRSSKNNHSNSSSFSVYCDAGLVMKYDGIVKEKSRKRLKFRCPIITANKQQAKTLPPSCPINHPKFCSGKKYGCIKYFNPDSVVRNFVHSNLKDLYNSLYNSRKSVERLFSRIHHLNIEHPTMFHLDSIRNYVTIALIAQNLITLVAGVILKDITAIRRYKHFAKNAPPIKEIKFKLSA